MDSSYPVDLFKFGSVRLSMINNPCWESCFGYTLNQGRKIGSKTQFF